MKPPLPLVQLSTLPQHRWHGRAVFHPHSQDGEGAKWEIEGEVRYDVGVVVKWWTEDGDDVRVRFIGDSGSTLQYGAWNLWTPLLLGEER
jgi:hypothetical protein